MTEEAQSQEVSYTVKQVAKLWNMCPETVRKVFRGRSGLWTTQGGGKGSWRIPASLVYDVMLERGYTKREAQRVFELNGGGL